METSPFAPLGVRSRLSGRRNDGDMGVALLIIVLSSPMHVIAFSFSSSLSSSSLSRPHIVERIIINDNDPPSLNARTSTANTTKRNTQTMHLISLPPTDNAYISPGESLIRECWRWKDATLGDGRDSFLPKPRALKEFHSLFVGMEIIITNNEEVSIVRPPSSSMRESSNARKTRLSLHVDDSIVNNNNDGDGGSTTLNDNNGCVEKGRIQRSFINEEQQGFVIEECVALSNCARLDVILVLKREKKLQHQQQQWLNEDMTDSSHAARYAVAYNLQQQVQSRRSNSSSSLLDRIGLTTLMDLPGAIRKKNNDNYYDDETETFSTNENGQRRANEIRQLANRLSTMEGARSISTHLSLVASGLSPRPNRPDREVLFRPYSSRDAHILLQLKRTVELVSALNMTTTENGGGGGGGGRGRIKTLLDSALTAGKASRNERVVPEIRRLKEFGSNGTPPSALARVVAEVSFSFGHGADQHVKFHTLNLMFSLLSGCKRKSSGSICNRMCHETSSDGERHH